MLPSAALGPGGQWGLLRLVLDTRHQGRGQTHSNFTQAGAFTTNPWTCRDAQTSKGSYVHPDLETQPHMEPWKIFPIALYIRLWTIANLLDSAFTERPQFLSKSNMNWTHARGRSKKATIYKPWRGLGRNQPCSHPDFVLLSSKTVRK
jgi:hypothetical protein